MMNKTLKDYAEEYKTATHGAIVAVLFMLSMNVTGKTLNKFDICENTVGEAAGGIMLQRQLDRKHNTMSKIYNSWRETLDNKERTAWDDERAEYQAMMKEIVTDDMLTEMVTDAFTYPKLDPTYEDGSAIFELTSRTSERWTGKCVRNGWYR